MISEVLVAAVTERLGPKHSASGGCRDGGRCLLVHPARASMQISFVRVLQPVRQWSERRSQAWQLLIRKRVLTYADAFRSDERFCREHAECSPKTDL